MEAALRTASEKLSGEELQSLNFKEVRGIAGIKEATYCIKGETLKVAVVSGLGNARYLLNKVKKGEADCAPSVGSHYIKTMRVAQFVNLMKIRQL